MKMRRLGTVLIVGGLLVLAYAAAVLFWRDPVTDLYNRYQQNQLESALEHEFEAWDAGDHATALERLQEALADPERRDAIRRIMVAIFTELGADDPQAREYRRRLSAALN